MANRINTINSLFANFPGQAIRFRWLILSAVIMLTVFMLFGVITRFSINTNANSFLDANDPAITALNKFRSQFGSDDSVFLVYRAKEGDVFSKSALTAVQQLTHDLENWRLLSANNPNNTTDKAPNLDALQHIRRVQSLSNIRVQSAQGDTLISKRLIPNNLPDDAVELAKLKADALSLPDYQLAFYSPDGAYSALLIQTDFGSLPSKDYVPKIDSAAVTLDASFADTAQTPITFDPSAEVQTVNYAKVDNQTYAHFVKALQLIYSKYDQQLEFYPVGYPPLMEFVQQVLQQSAALNVGMILINVILLWVLFRSLSAVFWPIVTILLSILWVCGATAWLGKSFSSMITLTVMLVFVCGMADCIHVISLYQSHRQAGMAHSQAISHAYADTGWPMLITSLTNMAGMLALIFSDFYPIRVFAGMSSLGVGLAYFFTLLLLPILLDFWPPISKKPAQKRGWLAQLTDRWHATSALTQLSWINVYAGFLLVGLGLRWGGYIAFISLLTYVLIRWHKPLLASLPNFAARHFVRILIGFGALIVICCYGERQLRIDSNVTELTREGSAIRVAYQVADTHMAGTQNLEIMVDTQQAEGILNPKILMRIDALQQALKVKYPNQISRSYSLANVVKDTNKIMHEDQADYYKIPDNQPLVSQLLYLFNSVNPSDRRSLVSDDYSQSHISLNIISAGSAQYQTFFKEINQAINDSFADLKTEFPGLSVTVTGTVPLAMRTQAIIAESQYSGFLLALAVISVIIFITLGSFQAGLISLIPNIIPALFTYGAMGLLNIPLDTDTLLLAPVIIGLAVDDTIHFMSHYRGALLKLQDHALALKNTLTEVGPSVLFTGMVLGLGFSIQGFSDYLGSAKMGIFGGLAIFVGILCELLLLPALLTVFKPSFGLKKSTTPINLTGI